MFIIMVVFTKEDEVVIKFLRETKRYGYGVIYKHRFKSTS